MRNFISCLFIFIINFGYSQSSKDSLLISNQRILYKSDKIDILKYDTKYKRSNIKPEDFFYCIRYGLAKEELVDYNILEKYNDSIIYISYTDLLNFSYKKRKEKIKLGVIIFKIQSTAIDKLSIYIDNVGECFNIATDLSLLYYFENNIIILFPQLQGKSIPIRNSIINDFEKEATNIYYKELIKLGYKDIPLKKPYYR